MSQTDSTWAEIGRRCAAAEPAGHPPADSSRRQVAYDRDEQWAAIAREVPGGFAGLYVEGRRAVVLLTDTLQKDAALPAVARRIPRPDLDIEHARVVPARWDFAQLYDWSVYIAAQRLQFDGLTSIDIDERGNRLVYGFPDVASIRAAQEQIRPLELPCYLVAFVIEQPARIR